MSSDDLFTRTVIQAGFEAAAQEMFDTLRKTAMSPIIYEVLDVGTGVLDADGQLVSSGAGIPGFIGVLDKSVKAILASAKEPVEDGDVFILNDPNFGGVTHLNDIVLAEPVFFQGKRVAWVASIAHWGDIGGKTPGSMAVDVTEIIAEGLRLPPVKIYKAGQRNEAVVDIIRCNSRLPDFALGDLSAQFAAGRRGNRVIVDLFQRYGRATVFDAIEAGFDEGKTRALDGLAALPKGRFSFTATQDDGEEWAVSLEISDTRFIFDLTAAPDAEAAPHNTSRDGAMVVCQMFFKALTDPERFANAGSFAPLEVRTREGSVFHADPTKPQGYYFETRIRLFDLLWQAMAQAMPDRLPAGHFGTIFGTVIAGTHPDTGRRYTMVEPQMGGWGATGARDGTGPLFSSSHGDTFNCPVEIAEARYGYEVLEKSLIFSEGSAVEFRGGPGICSRYQMRAKATLSAGFSRAKEPVWSLNATSGHTNSLKVHRARQTVEDYVFVSGLELAPEDVVEIRTSCGGNAARAG
ncbi:hydantoinase B/oxoprolinase family protein [Ruegeria sp. HKCCD7255]|uniref:hydantoinase B/oxoprolinase family protein n=1 Tax=Ruegeria sp. HKCCD7255 TaxID=2683004 RepID=UPI001487DEC2|nr:hydantoinase B/oxoprolinase family protein [Ruegeria sp. HKCCD7255]